MKLTKSRSFVVWIVSPAGYVHARCFAELQTALVAGLHELGHDAYPVASHTLPALRDGDTLIVLGSHLLDDAGAAALPRDAVIYQSEQVESGSSWFAGQYLNTLRAHTVWDYSPRNIDQLARHGIDATLCEVGYHEFLTSISRSKLAQPIDVLHIGSLSARRMDALQSMRALGLRVEHIFGLYGAERDAWISRSKLVVNVHYYEAKVLEVVRLQHLLANGIPVVSEVGADLYLDGRYAEAVAFAPYNRLAQTCAALVADDRARSELGHRGLAVFSRMRQALGLAHALRHAR